MGTVPMELDVAEALIRALGSSSHAQTIRGLVARCRVAEDRVGELEAENAELRSGIGTLLAASNKLARQVLAFTRGDPVPVEAPALGVRLELAEEDGA